MEVNETYYGFKLVSVKDNEDYKLKEYEFYHPESGARLIYLSNDDINKCFMVGFRTLPSDNSGVPHIIEHTMLCGSDKYPLKEPFVNLLKGSQATFLNAMTASDWTAYPIASCNDHDFNNLMSVYLDAVFNPLSIKNELPFLQEGWHYELFNKDDPLTIKGVVYNEMQGAMSSPEEQLNQYAINSLYEGTRYGVNSGGEPDNIPDLTYEAYKSFYKKFYHPSNAIFYLYGKMDVLEKLKYINDNYLVHYHNDKEKITCDVASKHINLNYQYSYALSEDETEADNTYFSLNFALCPFGNKNELNSLKLLVSYLMDDNSSPLKKALLDAKIGQDADATINDDNPLPGYLITLKKSNKEHKDKFVNIVFNTIKKVIKEGIDKKKLLALLNNAEFKDKEMDNGSTPTGLLYAFEVLQCFDYDLPLDSTLYFNEYYKFAREQLETDYYEKLLQKYFIDSEFYTLVTLTPSLTLGKEKEAALEKKLKDIKDNMSPKDIADLIAMNNKLLEYQNHKDTKEELKLLPSLKKEDITINPLKLPLVEDNDKFKKIIHKINTNGICYLSLYFDLECLSEEEICYAALLTNLYRNLDSNHYSLNDLTTLVKTYLGSFSTSINLFSSSQEECKIKLCVDISCLEENYEKISEIFNEVIFHTVFDEDKVKILLNQMVTSLHNAMIESGHVVATTLLRSSTSKHGKLNSLLKGYNNYLFLKEIQKKKFADIAKMFETIINKIFNRNNLIASLSGEDTQINLMTEQLDKLSLFNHEFNKVLSLKEEKDKDLGLIIPSQVSYCTLGKNVNDLNYKYSGSFTLLNQIVNYDYLWPEIRVKGGAYGCALGVQRNGDLTLMTYRDPNCKNSYEIFKNLPNFLKNFEIDDDLFLTYLIGAMGEYDKPGSVKYQISLADTYYFMGLSYDDLIKTRKETLNTTKDDIKNYYHLFESLNAIHSKVTVGNEKKIKEEKFSEIIKLS